MIAARQLAFGKAGEAPPAYWGLCFTAEEDGSTVAMEAVGSAPAVSLETSYDGEIWEPFYVGETLITLNKGERVYFKAGEGGNTRFATSTSAYNKFSLVTGKIAASGDIMSLLNGDVTSDTIPINYCYRSMFYGCESLVTAPELPATTLAANCYDAMFYGCTSLVAAPELHATKLVVGCYRSMFYGCESLVTAPELPAMTLAASCYYSMFYGCESLVTAPELHATTLAVGCYRSMFYGCESLVTAPELPATTLATDCYRAMFYGCASLVDAPELPATILTSCCYYRMFQGCTKINEIKVAFSAWNPTDATTGWVEGLTQAGTFRCPTALGTNETITRGISACPGGWTVINID